MISIDKRIQALIYFGEALAAKLENFNSGNVSELQPVIVKAKIENPWFTEKNTLLALENWSLALRPENVNSWMKPYLPKLDQIKSSKNIGVVNAGNIPFVGLHDLLSVLVCGHNYIGKNATGDGVLLPYLASILTAVEPAFEAQINFVPRLNNVDAVIATGNNNSARYFEYYFGKYPHIIRKNRNGVGVLAGNESKEQLNLLGRDIFSYFGLGCRNVSKLYVPAGYNFNNFFEAIFSFQDLMMHNKFMNNFDYNNSVLLLKQIPFLQNGFLIIRKENQIASPVSVVHYEEYDNVDQLERNLSDHVEQLQCVVSNEGVFSDTELEKIRVDFGKTQSPELWEYADGVDTVEFLCSL